MISNGEDHSIPGYIDLFYILVIVKLMRLYRVNIINWQIKCLGTNGIELTRRNSTRRIHIGAVWITIIEIFWKSVGFTVASFHLSYRSVI